MPGGLLNLVSYGNQNIILNGNPSKTFFKCVYSKYTNFGLQKFRIDYEGLRNIRETETSRFKFKIPRYGDLLMDTYLVINLPNIWSPILPPTTDNSSIKQTITDIWKPYEFKWIKDLGTQLIERVRFTVGNSTIQEFTGQYLKCMVERDFDNTKKDLYDRMTGNIPELNDPANAFQRNGYYPNVYPTNIPNFNIVGPEPSIRARKLYIPLNIWFTLASKMAFPLVSLQYQEFYIEVDIRPLNELFTVRDMETVVNPTTNSPFLPAPDNGWENLPTSSVTIGPHIKPDFSNQLYQFYRFLQPPPSFINIKNKVHIVVGAGTITNTESAFVYSLDGKNWIDSPEQSIFSYIISISSNKDNFFVAMGRKSNNIDNANEFAYSSDGKNWLPSPTPVGSIFTLRGFGQIAYGNNMWVAVGQQSTFAPGTGNQFAYSFDGKNWVTSPTPEYSIFLGGTTVKYANGIWVAGGIPNDPLTPPIVNTRNRFAYSFDGINWQASPTPTPVDKIYAVVVSIEYGNNLWVATQSSGVTGDHITETAYSTDGINWVANPVPNIISEWAYGGLAYGNGVWVSIGSSYDPGQSPIGNELSYSLNGKDWLPAETPRRTIFNPPMVGNAAGHGSLGEIMWDDNLQLFIATSRASDEIQSNEFAYSSDGKNWLPSPTVQGSLVEIGSALGNGYYYEDTNSVLEDWKDKNTIWNTDIHLESTYAFLTDEEVKTFAANEQKYLIKQAYHYIHDNIVDSAKPSLISSLGMVSNWMWYFQRDDVNLRNQWSNYTNWEYDYQPYSVVDPSGCFDLNGTPTLGTPNAPLVTVISSGGSTQQVNPANNPGGFNTGYKITGNYQLANQKTIMRTWGLLLNGKYRETTQDAGVLDYIEKYTRTSGNAPDGLYCYNFCLHTNPFDFQPSGAINISKFNQIEFELTTYPPPLNPNSQRIDICDASGNSIGVDKPVWNIYNYTYNLNILEERYNILSFIGGNASLMYAR